MPKPALSPEERKKRRHEAVKRYRERQLQNAARMSLMRTHADIVELQKDVEKLQERASAMFRTAIERMDVQNMLKKTARQLKRMQTALDAVAQTYNVVITFEDDVPEN